jgi:hypothetical protein
MARSIRSRVRRPAPVLLLLVFGAAACTPVTQRSELYLSASPGGGPSSARGLPRPDPSPDAFRAAVRACDDEMDDPPGIGEYAARQVREALADCMGARGYQVLSGSGARIVETRAREDGRIPAVTTYVVLTDPAADSACHYEARRRLITAKAVGDQRRRLHDSMVADCQRAKAKGELVWDVVTR